MINKPLHLKNKCFAIRDGDRDDVPLQAAGGGRNREQQRHLQWLRQADL